MPLGAAVRDQAHSPMTDAQPQAGALAKRPGREGPSVELGANAPLRLDCGVELGPFTMAYQTYGELNADRSNVVLVCHALTGDQYVASTHPVTGKPGWWHLAVGPGRTIDTERYFVICANVLGGCMGTAGPADINPANGKLWGLDFPVITVADMVRAQAAAARPSRHRRPVLRHRRLDGRHAGAGMGGELPRAGLRRRSDSPAARHSAQNIAFHEVGRQAIMADPEWQRRRLSRLRQDGPGARPGRRPHGRPHHLPVRAGAAPQVRPRACRTATRITYGFEADFQVESYLRHQGIDLRRTLRRQFVPLHHPGDGLFRSRRRAWRRSGRGLPAARRRASAWSPSPATGCFPTSESARDRPCAQRRGGQRLASSRSRPTRGMTRSCSTSRRCSSHPEAASSKVAAEHRGIRHP